ncbi:hypothetical protein FOA52_006728 [Chlamydomonas sp. UWO 241]|nr:hypothetical protein FOA52_006728 [Chlamydomonas sp. UWO 241]
MTVGGGPPAKADANTRPIKVLVFDLDDTLYRCHGIGSEVLAGIQGFMTKPFTCSSPVHHTRTRAGFMARHLGYTLPEAVAKATELYLAYGTTLAGLVEAGAKIDVDQWHKEVHHGHVNYAAHIHADPALRELLFSIDLPKYVFTNADKTHMEICLRLLGIEDCFQGVFHFENLHELAAASGDDTPAHPHVVCKPAHRAYELVFAKIGVPADQVLFFDDSLRNVKAAQEVGAMAVLVGKTEPHAGADLVMKDLHCLPRLLPELIDQPGLVKEVPAQHALAHSGSMHVTAATA